MGDDVVARAKAALDGLPSGDWYDCQNGWIGIEVDQCTCGGPIEYYGHQPGCGLEPLLCDIPIQLRPFIAASRSLVPELVAEVERLHSWDGLMSLVDEHYPESIFPTTEDREDRDMGPRIVSLLRQLNAAREAVSNA